jgi:hypothetical protein
MNCLTHYRIVLTIQTILPKTGRPSLRTTRELRTAGITRANPERRGSVQSTDPFQMVEIPTFVDGGDLKNPWFADLLAAKLATEFSQLVPPIGRLSRQISSVGTAVARDRGGPHAGRMILFLLPVSIELVEKCDKITALLLVLQTRIDHLRARNLCFRILDIFPERRFIPGNPRVFVSMGVR